MSKIKFFALGGLDERGKSMYCLEVNEDLFVLDCGLAHPSSEMYGINAIVAQFSYLKENRYRCRGVFLSTGSPEQMGGIVHLLKEIPDIPIYCGKLTQFLIEVNAERLKIGIDRSVFKNITRQSVLPFKNAVVFPFQEIYSIPECFGFSFKTDDGVIIYATNYIFDPTSENDYAIDIKNLIALQDQCLLLIHDSRNMGYDDFTSPHHRSFDFLNRQIRSTPNRIIVAGYEDDLFLLSSLFRAAVANNRPVIIYGYHNYQYFRKALEYNLIKTHGARLLPHTEIPAAKNAIVFLSGSFNRLYKKIMRIALSGDELIKIVPSDKFLIVAAPVTGNELDYSNCVDEIARTDCTVELLERGVSRQMHPSGEDLRFLLRLTKPNYFIPVSGLFKDLQKGTWIAAESGVKPEHSLLLDNGETVNFIGGKYNPKLNHKISAEGKFVSAVNFSDVQEVVLKDRSQMAISGVLVVYATLDKENHQLTSEIDISARGVSKINPTKFRELRDKIRNVLTNLINEHQKLKNKFLLNNLIKDAKRSVSKVVNKNIGKEPIVLASLIEI